jgi:N-acetylneuraminic acid mutarotase
MCCGNDTVVALPVAAGASAATDAVGASVFPGTWQSGPAMPHDLAEVAAGVISGKLYVVGELDPATFVYDIAAGTWTTGAARPFPGNHHAAEVINNKLYLFGGLTAGSDGKVQVYDPAADAWTLGADMPFAAGSSSTALIGGKVYVAGGIVGEHTTDRVAAYDPATDTWAERAPMPQGRNHTAAATDGQKLYVFGGRGPGSGDRNVTTNGFDTTQVYDPAADAWDSSENPGSTLPPLPQARGGMGKAVYLGGKFYVVGGETLTGAGATDDGVYRRVDVYHPAGNTWTTETDMPTARHGIFPVESGGKIYVAGGGVHFGGSGSDVLEIFTPFRLPDPPPLPPPASVVGRWVFYNNSVFDGNDPAANAADDAAVATDKTAVTSGPTRSFANYTSYSKGINGIMVDVLNLPAGAAPSAADFTFVADDQPAPPPTSITVRRGAGVNGSDRVTLTWPDGQIQKTWLQVGVEVTANTGLTTRDNFAFGNWPGETGNKPGVRRRLVGKGRVVAALVNNADAALVKKNFTGRRHPGPAPITSAFDFDRDGVVGQADRQIARSNRTSRKQFLVLF